MDKRERLIQGGRGEWGRSLEGMQIFITCRKRDLKVSQDKSRSEVKTEFHGIYRREEGVNCIYISFIVEPNATAGGFVRAKKRKWKKYREENCIMVRKRKRGKNEVVRSKC